MDFTKKNEGLKWLVPLLFLFMSCDTSQKDEPVNDPGYPEKAKSMNIYEVNLRQYTPEGTINAFLPHLPRLEAMGVDILWIMPIQPIGMKSRKGEMGSFYSIRNYTEVNPDLGTIEDFKNLVTTAHEKDMIVILDWVANHTSFDHKWTEKEGFYTTDSLGNIIWPAGTDWTDVADLNYDNEEMRTEMIDEMKWWVENMDIDGFRCDVAGHVPMDFWHAAKDSLDKVKDLFMLAEWDEPKMHEVFHMTFGWGPHHWMNETAKGHFNADSMEVYMMEDVDRYDGNAFRMMFTTNHDENSWNGTVFERFGEGHQAYAVWAFTVRGMPLIYSGQEAGLDKRLSFFGKDIIDFDQVAYEDFYTRLLSLKHQNKAFFNGSFGGDLTFLEDKNENVSSYIRSSGDNKVLVIVNFSNEQQEIVLDPSFLEKELVDEIKNKKYTTTNNGVLTLPAYEYIVTIL